MFTGPEDLGKLIAPAVEALGYEFVGLEYRSGARGGLLRVYIDSEDGVTVDDCQSVSYQVSGLLDVEDPIPGHYTLEISSPGLDRPLFQARDYDRFAGHRVRIQLTLPLDGRRKFSGVLRGMRGDNVLVEQDGDEVSIPYDQIRHARLVPEY
jgi:ribosome maturation factor RimP